MPPGRPDVYKEDYHPDSAFKLSLLGMTQAEIAEQWQISEKIFYEWKKKYPELSKAIKKGTYDADGEIARSLYHRAKGYSHPEDKIFNDNGSPLIVPTIKHYPPDTGAAALWLKNRRPRNWRDKIEVDQGDSGPVDVKALAQEIRGLVAENGFHDVES